MEESLLYSYGMLFCNTFGKVMFYGGTSYYHNIIIMGLVLFERANLIELKWKSSEVVKDRLEVHAKKDENKFQQIYVKYADREVSFPEQLEEYRFLYERIPSDHFISFVQLMQRAYRYEMKQTENTMNAFMKRELLKRQLVLECEKKGWFGQRKRYLAANEEKLQALAQSMEEKLSEEQELSQEQFILYYLAKTEGMLPKLFGKEKAKNIYDKIEQLSKKEPYCFCLFIKLWNLVSFLEENIFLSFSVGDNEEIPL
ncbi:hypothetical protein [[Clostridium] polysaccharolyticum]|uniref:Uncharacterized protein n=1 Tax=[Clostridium] polysaccharolyticum TaxID=29364 RepID=A0A1I0BG08_9FIRM|nr:hypothetical protein [[Clostridium] polysaccharolyticum]SET05729.1 hypothetical protein SAMN04487772_107114 [[Clostridium] polysaccharolyticum]